MSGKNTLPTATLACPLCDISGFSNRTKFRGHLKSIHFINLPPLKSGRPTGQKSALTGTCFSCPACTSIFQTIELLGVHLKAHQSTITDSKNSQESLELEPGSDGDETGGENQVITIPSSVTFPASRLDIDIEETIMRRPYQNAILYACQQTNDTSNNDKIKTIHILETMNLRPFSIFNNGVEQTALAHPTVIEKCISEHSRIESIPLKRSFYDMYFEGKLCTNCSFENPHGIHNMLAMSPYIKLLQKRKYVELSAEYCDLLNYDWTFHPQMKYFAAQLLAGSIINNATNNETIMVNTIEVYGRKKIVDIHREPFGNKKHNAIPTSLPPPCKTRYFDVWPTTLNSKDGPTLVIGTQTFNALITSSIRLDQTTRPSVGGVTTNFQLLGVDSLSTNIYLDEECIEKAKSLAENTNATSVSNANIMNQLRHLSTKFDEPSTYYLCRASGPITKSHQCYPYSIYTLYDFDRGRNPGSKIFANIGTSVLKNGDQASLKKALVDECVSGTVGKAKELLIDINALFVDGVQEIPILGNHELNNRLEKLATWLHPYIITANDSAEAAIVQSFAYFKN